MILQGTVKGKGGRQNRWDDNIKELTGMDFARSTRATEKQDKAERDCFEVMCGAQTTVQGYGWLTRDFTSFSTVFQSYQDDGWIMKG